jgi:hypothetical protein
MGWPSMAGPRGGGRCLVDAVVRRPWGSVPRTVWHPPATMLLHIGSGVARSLRSLTVTPAGDRRWPSTPYVASVATPRGAKRCSTNGRSRSAASPPTTPSPSNGPANENSSANKPTGSTTGSGPPPTFCGAAANHPYPAEHPWPPWSTTPSRSEAAAYAYWPWPSWTATEPSPSPTSTATSTSTATRSAAPTSSNTWPTACATKSRYDAPAASHAASTSASPSHPGEHGGTTHPSCHPSTPTSSAPPAPGTDNPGPSERTSAPVTTLHATRPSTTNRTTSPRAPNSGPALNRPRHTTIRGPPSQARPWARPTTSTEVHEPRHHHVQP